MRIGFDCSTAAFSQVTGTGVYVRELVAQYEQLFPQDHIIFTYRLSRRIRGARFLVHRREPQTSQHTLIDPLTFWRGYQYDIFHGLNSRLPMIAGCKKVATIHDLFSVFGEFSKEPFRSEQKARLLQMISRANHYIAVSQYTKDVMVRQLHVRPEFISVVHNGVKDVYRKDYPIEESRRIVDKLFGIGRPYFFYVGAFEKRKNVVGIIESYNMLCERLAVAGKPLPLLVLVGHPSFGYDEIQSRLESSRFNENIYLLNHLDENKLYHLYRASLGLIFLSWEEGFGIPVLEAMSCGIPVISSNSTSLPEASGGYSILVSPDDYHRVSQHMESLLNPSDEIKARVADGQKYARIRSWQHVAKETRAVYEKVLIRH